MALGIIFIVNSISKNFKKSNAHGWRGYQLDLFISVLKLAVSKHGQWKARGNEGQKQ